MPVLSQDGLSKSSGSVLTYGDANVRCVTNLTDDPRAAIVALSSAPLAVSLKHYNKVSIRNSNNVQYCATREIREI